MTVPGSTITRGDANAIASIPGKISMQFVAGELQRGPDTPELLTSLRALQQSHGDRTLESTPTYDWLANYWQESRNSPVYVVALRGPDAEYASATVPAASGTAGTVQWLDKGDYGNEAALKITAVNGGGYTAELLIDGASKWITPTLTTALQLQQFCASERALNTIKFTPGAGGAPKPTTSPIALDGGDDDFDGVDIDTITAALAKFVPDLGPGTVVLPGRTALSAHLAVREHVTSDPEMNRIARVQLPDLPIDDIAAHLEQLQVADEGETLIDAIAGQQVVPGLTSETSGRVDATALAGGREAVLEREGKSPNQPAAGDFGQATVAVGISRPFSRAELERINDLGGRILKMVDGRVQLYGSRVVSNAIDQPAGFRLGAARLRMAVIDLLAYRNRRTNFAEWDVFGIAEGEYRGLVRKDIERFAGSLYSLTVEVAVVAGETPGERIVDTQVELQITHDAEVIRANVKRTTKEL